MPRILHLIVHVHVIACFMLALFGGLKAFSINCPPTCDCLKSVTSVHVQCCKTGKHISKMPALPKETTVADLSNCHIEEIPDGIFTNASSLLRLDLSGHRLAKLGSGAFVGLTILTHFNISHGGKYLKSVEKGLFSTLPALYSLDVGFNEALKLSQLPDILSGLNKTKIRELYLDGINSYKYSTEGFLPFEYVQLIEELDLEILSMISMCVVQLDYKILKMVNKAKCFSFASNFVVLFTWSNTIVVLEAMAENNNTRVLHMNNQAHSYLVKEDQNLVQYSHQLRRQLISACETSRKIRPVHREVVLQENMHGNLKQSRSNVLKFTVFKNMDSVYIDRCIRGFGIGNIVFTHNRLRVFSCRYTTGLELTGPIIGLNHIEEVSFAGSYLTIKDPETLAFMPTLLKLDLSHCHLLDQMAVENTSLVKNMKSLKTLNLAHNEIASIDLHYLARQAPNLQSLNLARNKLNSVPRIDTSGTLKYLDLSENNFVTLDYRDRSQLEAIADDNNNQVVINISGNPFDCDCSRRTFVFLHWLQTTRITIADRENLTCNAPWKESVGLKRIVALHGCVFCSFWFECYRFWIIGLGGFVGAFISLVITVTSIYKNRWFLRYKYYTMIATVKRCAKRQQPRTHSEFSDESTPLLQSTSDKVVFVIYIYDWTTHDRTASPEYQFVHGQLGRAITEAGFTPIFHQEFTNGSHPLPYRFLGNKPEDDEICATISETACAFIVVSPALSNDTSYKRLIPFTLEKSSDYSFVLMFGKVEYQALMKKDLAYLNNLLKRGRYAEWSEEEEAQQLFYARVTEHLKAH